MSEMRRYAVTALAPAIALTGYFGAYFLAADYTDVGSNVPMYLVQYHIGPVPLHRCALFFEPARKIDDLCFRHRYGTVMH